MYTRLKVVETSHEPQFRGVDLRLSCVYDMNSYVITQQTSFNKLDKSHEA